jgi:A/G-specific adenine glycosylase
MVTSATQTRRPAHPGGCHDGAAMAETYPVGYTGTYPAGYTGPLLAWYSRSARDLPWRGAGASPWSVLVSEMMLQQTPVTRVLPAHAQWLTRWPAPAALAAEPPAEAIRQWGRLGYPRRALWLHASAGIIATEHGGQVPSSLATLRALPGVGSYTAAAVATFAYGQRHAVLDTNVRRVLARLAGGVARPAGAATSVAEARLAESLLPTEPAVAARWSVALMELGALVCTATAPRCEGCPLRGQCAWLGAGKPTADGNGGRRAQRYDGTDRQCRGRLLSVLRESAVPVSRVAFDPVWPDKTQLDRALDSLVADGLVDPLPGARFSLPASPAVSLPPSPPVSRPGSPAVSLPPSPAVSRPASPSVSRPGSGGT